MGKRNAEIFLPSLSICCVGIFQNHKELVVLSRRAEKRAMGEAA